MGKNKRYKGGTILDYKTKIHDDYAYSPLRGSNIIRLTKTPFDGLCGRLLQAVIFDAEPPSTRIFSHRDLFPSKSYQLDCGSINRTFLNPGEEVRPFSDAVRGSPCIECLCKFAATLKRDADVVSGRMKADRLKIEREQKRRERQAHKKSKVNNFREKMKRVLAKEKSEVWRKR